MKIKQYAGVQDKS